MISPSSSSTSTSPSTPSSTIVTSYPVKCKTNGLGNCVTIRITSSYFYIPMVYKNKREREKKEKTKKLVRVFVYVLQ